MKSVWDGFMWVTSKLAVPLTIGGALLLPFFGAVANRTKIANPDADFGDLLGGWFGATVTDPNSVLAVDPELAISPDEVLTGVDGVMAGIGGIFDGWGHIFTAAWDVAVPLAVDIGLTGGAGSLTSAFSAVSGISEICEINPFDPSCG